MSELMHRQLLTGVIESLANKALSLDPATKSKLSSLSEKSMSVTVDEIGFPLCFTVSNERIVVTSVHHEACAIQCNLAVLSQLTDAGALTHLIKSDQLILSGDINIAQDFASIGKSLNIDWQAQLSSYIGDIATYKLSLIGASIKQKFNFFKQQVEQDSSEWLLHEFRAAAHASQVSDFSQQVNGINRQVDLLDQRIRSLTEQLAQ